MCALLLLLLPSCTVPPACIRGGRMLACWYKVCVRIHAVGVDIPRLYVGVCRMLERLLQRVYQWSGSLLYGERRMARSSTGIKKAYCKAYSLGLVVARISADSEEYSVVCSKAGPCRALYFVPSSDHAATAQAAGCVAHHELGSLALRQRTAAHATQYTVQGVMLLMGSNFLCRVSVMQGGSCT